MGAPLEPEETQGFIEPEPGEPRLLAAWMAVRHAELMLAHFTAAPRSWPNNAIYCHSCVTALRSVTLLMQKALRHADGFDGWYASAGGPQDAMGRDDELAYLLKARNLILKQGVLRIMWSGNLRMTGGPPGLLIHGLSEEHGPVVSVPDPGSEDGPRHVDWREVEGFEYTVTIKFGPQKDLPPPPDRDVREVLADKVLFMQALLEEAEARFDPESASEPEPHL